jgi:2-polyprenyl-6-methoxyphenol hydroxylase-like FAD-dependent oxidoreductase
MRVLVVGGGIGGLSTAIALRERDVDVDVVEINPKWDVYGVGIIQPANAIRALDALGLAEKAVEQGYAMKGSRFHDSQGNLLGQVPALDLLGPKYPPMNGITRPRLHAIFQDAVKRSGANIRLGVTVDSVGEDGKVALSDGAGGEYDLIVAADGIHSRVRGLVFPDAPEPEYTGQIVWRYNVPRPEELDTLDMFVGANGKAGFVPLSPDLMYILYIEAVPAEDVKMADDRLAEIFRERLAEFGGPVAEIRDRHITDPAKVVVRPVESLLVPAPWSRGRVVLVGDAAHATSPHVGQGGAMAIEDAIVLAEEVTSGDDLETALERYADRRYPRCHEIWEISRQIGTWEIEHTPPPEADFVGLTMKSVHVTAAPV